MDADRWKRISALFHAARSQEPTKRKAFLRAECGQDTVLHQEVEALLDAEPRVDHVLTDAVADAARTFEEADLKGPKTGHRVGPYQLVREIGQGGMGRVFLAHRADGQFEQKVALKLVRRGMDSHQLLLRFRQERQILARLHHPNIARLLDGGVTEDGQPFFALEYVEGLPIDEYCNTHRLTVDERLVLFQDVCRAVSYAHRQLVVHRDLKPDNILVTTDRQVRLLDFGIAKLLAENGQGSNLTETGLWIMTPAYASPEQVRGEPVGTATDVYSLGVVLYELLAGVRPYEIEGRSPTEVERVVCESQPERPSTRVEKLSPSANMTTEAISLARRTEPVRLRKRLTGDLDVICLEALRKEHDRRYGSVEAMSEDVRRHLDGLPVLARPDSVGYRVGKALRRHRLAVAAVVAVVLSTTGVVGFYTARLAAERDRAQIEAAKAREVSDFVRGLFAVSDPSESRGETITARELLDEGAQRIEDGLADQPEVQATMMRVIGEVYANLGLFDEARPLLERALAQHESLLGPDNPEVATSKIMLGTVLQDIGEVEKAGVLFREGLQQRQRIFGAEHAEVSEVLGILAYWFETNGDYEPAEEHYRRALALDRQFYPPDDPRVTKSLVDLGGMLRRVDQPSEAEPLLREGLAMQRRYYGDRHPDVASTARNLAALLRDLGQFAEADTLYREVLQTRRALFGDAHPDVATALNSYALLLERMGEPERAIATYRELINIYQRIYGGPHSNIVAVYNNLATALRDEGQFEEAIVFFDRSIATGDDVIREDHPNRAFPRIGLASLYREQGSTARAVSLFREALAIRRNGLPPGHRYIGETLSDLGASLVELGRYEEAQLLQHEAYEVLLAAEGSDASRTKRARARLVVLYDAWGRPDDAAPFR